jgi:serine/threonine-protein kinase
MIHDAEAVSPRVTAMSADDSSANPAALVGRSIAGKFVIDALVATGGAGTVYRARQLALDRVVALKVLRQDVARDNHFVERFKREARAASRLDHPNSVRVFDFGHVDESLL